MAILERQVKFIIPEKAAERAAAGPQIDAIEAKHGYPPLRRYRLLSGPEDMGTEVLEREWPSFAAMEEAIVKCQADPEYQEIIRKYGNWVRNSRIEYYLVIN